MPRPAATSSNTTGSTVGAGAAHATATASRRRRSRGGRTARDIEATLAAAVVPCQPDLRWNAVVAGLLLAGVLLTRVSSSAEPPAAASALDAAIAAAEASLQKGDVPAAQAYYREVLFQGWLTRATLD